jgi:Tfp pilus assembly protein PilV
MTLMEVLVALLLFGVVFATVLKGLIQANMRAAWIACDAAASKIAEQRLEQMQNARWDTSLAIDEVIQANFPTNVVALDTNPNGGSAIVATSTVQVVTITNSTLVYKVITSNVRWRYLNRGPFTNSVFTIRGQDQ